MLRKPLVIKNVLDTKTRWAYRKQHTYILKGKVMKTIRLIPVLAMAVAASTACGKTSYVEDKKETKENCKVGSAFGSIGCENQQRKPDKTTVVVVTTPSPTPSTETKTTTTTTTKTIKKTVKCFKNKIEIPCSSQEQTEETEKE